MDRRTFILTAAAAAIGLKANWVFSADLDNWLLEEVSSEQNLRSPSQLGQLSEGQYKQLYGLFLHIGNVWEMSGISGIQEWHFSDLVENKTTQLPSYLTEYIEAANVVAKIQNMTGKLDEAYARLLVPLDYPEFFIKTRLGRAQKYVSAELITWYVSQGGFKRFGYQNYRAFMGGLFTASPPPYRGA